MATQGAEGQYLSTPQTGRGHLSMPPWDTYVQSI